MAPYRVSPSQWHITPQSCPATFMVPRCQLWTQRVSVLVGPTIPPQGPTSAHPYFQKHRGAGEVHFPALLGHPAQVRVTTLASVDYICFSLVS